MKRIGIWLTLTILTALSSAEAQTNWSGPYVGLNTGYDKGRLENIVISPEGEPAGIKINLSGLLFGAQLGYNHLYRRIVVGLETDFKQDGNKGGIDSTNITLATDTLDFGMMTKINWLGTTRIRVGYSLGRFLPYITGGVSYGQPVTTTTITIGSLFLNTKETNGAVGSVLGGGTECMISRNFSVRGEYMHINFGISKINAVLSEGQRIESRKVLKGDVFRIGVNYRF